MRHSSAAKLDEGPAPGTSVEGADDDSDSSSDGEEEEGLIIAVDDFEKMSNLNISEIQPDSMH